LQFVSPDMNNVRPDYQSIGGFLIDAWSSGQYNVIIAWGMIAILISLTMELIIKEIGRMCMPSKYKDRQLIINIFKRKTVNHD
jgi:hypothetical protein